jgi:hypothetical protein
MCGVYVTRPRIKNCGAKISLGDPNEISGQYGYIRRHEIFFRAAFADALNKKNRLLARYVGSMTNAVAHNTLSFIDFSLRPTTRKFRTKL